MVRQIAVILIIFALTAGVVAASPNATDILKKSFDAEDKATFSGQLRTSVVSGGRTASAVVNVFQDGRRSRMEYTSGRLAGSAIIDDGRFVTRLDSSAKTAYISGTPDAPQRLDLLLANYTPVLERDAKIAGRDVYNVRLRPKHAGNPSQGLLIDKRTFVALKTERYGSNGRLTSSTEYVSIDYSARPDRSKFAVPRGWRSVRLAAQSDTTLEEVRKAVGFTPLRPGYVPRGYTFDGYYLRNTPGGMQFAGLRYTNGLNTISIFQRECDGPQGRGRGLGRLGLGRGEGRGQGPGMGQGNGWMLAENPHARMIARTSGDITIHVVADISQSELEKIAASFK